MRKHLLRGVRIPGAALVAAWAALTVEERRLIAALLARVEACPAPPGPAAAGGMGEVGAE